MTNRNTCLWATGLLIGAFAIACNQPSGPSPAPLTVPPGASALAESSDLLGSQAVGDVQNGPITIDLIRVQQPTAIPANPGFYANPGGVYNVQKDVPVEIWVQIWSANPALTDPRGPRVTVDWGTGEFDSPDFINCGPCKLTHTYRTPGPRTVRVSMDERNPSQRTTRTFVINVPGPALACSGTPFVLNDPFNSSSFDDFTSSPFGPTVANRMTFNCSSCYAHAHGTDVEDIYLEIHNPSTGAWTQIFTTQLVGSTGTEEYNFPGRMFPFPSQSVDQFRFRSRVGQGQTFHSWSSVTVTFSCGS